MFHVETFLLNTSVVIGVYICFTSKHFNFQENSFLVSLIDPHILVNKIAAPSFLTDLQFAKLNSGISFDLNKKTVADFGIINRCACYVDCFANRMKSITTVVAHPMLVLSCEKSDGFRLIKLDQYT